MIYGDNQVFLFEQCTLLAIIHNEMERFSKMSTQAKQALLTPAAVGGEQ